jgi:hypothetical protein
MLMNPSPGGRRLYGDEGSALMLMPAGVLIVFVLAAITVDLSLVHLARKELVNAASAAANDAATHGLSEQSLRGDGAYRLDGRRVEHAVLESLAARGLLDRLDGSPQVVVTGPNTVSVTLTLEVDYLFAKALPGERSATVRATATAVTESR